MTLLAGFDLVTEVSNPTITELIKKNMQLGGVPLNPPFELTLPFTGGSGHVIVDDMQLDLNDDDTMTIHLPFSNSSATMQSPVSKVICPLSGTISVKAALTLVSAGGSARQVAVNMSGATVTITYTAQANQAITSDLAGTGITAAQFKAFVQQAVTGFVQSAPNVTMPMGFSVVPGSNGSISLLQFSSLQVHCIGNADRNQQALGLFGNLLASTQSNGNHTGKTATAITPGRDMAISVSPGAFHSLVFCPAVASALGVSANSLPPSCGGSGGLGVSGVTLTSISDSFGNGTININGSVHDSGFCYEADGTFSGNVTLLVSGTTLTPTVNMNEPDVSIDIPWYCYLVVGAVLGPITAAILFAVDAVIDEVADKLASSALKDALGSGLGAISLGGLSSATFSSVSITPEGLTLQGMIPVFVPSSTFYKTLYLDGSVTTSSKMVVSTGVWTTKLWCQAEAKDYPYTEYAQRQVSTHDLTANMLATPISATYTVRRPWGPAIALSGSSGSVAIADTESTYPLPLATGGTKVTQTVHLDYEINGTIVKLKNHTEEGNFSVILDASVLDCSGSPPSGVDAEPSDWVVFEGSAVEMGGDYLEDYQECLDILQAMIDQLSDKFKQSWKWVPIWVKVNYPSPAEIFEQIRVLKEAGIREAQDLLLHSRIAHGASFARAFHAPSSMQLGKDRMAATQSVAARADAELKAQMAALTEQLAQVAQAQALGAPGKALNKRLR